jgi:hypothetical protein
MIAGPPLFSSCSNFLVNPLPTSVYSTNNLNLGWILGIFCVSLMICKKKNGYKNSLFSFFMIAADLYLFIYYYYFHLGPIFFKCIHFSPLLFSLVYYF